MKEISKQKFIKKINYIQYDEDEADEDVDDDDRKSKYT